MVRCGSLRADTVASRSASTCPVGIAARAEHDCLRLQMGRQGGGSRAVALSVSGKAV